MLKKYFSVPKAKLLFAVLLVTNVTYCTLSSALIYMVSHLMESIATDDTVVHLVVIAIAVITILMAIFGFTRNYVQRITVQQVYSYCAHQAIEKMLHVDYDVFTRHGEGHAYTVLDGVNGLSNAGKCCFDICQSIIDLTIVIISIGLITNVVILPILIIILISCIVISKLIKITGAISTKITKAKKTRTDEIDRIVNGFAEIRAFANQKFHQDKIDGLDNVVRTNVNKKAFIVSLFSFAFEIIDGLLVGIIIFFAFALIPRGDVTIAMMVALVSYVWSICGQVDMMLESFDELSMFKSQYKHFAEYMALKEQVTDGDIKLNKFTSSIVVDNVSFKYDDSDMVLKDVSFDIRKGEKIGIVGASGCGKTTLLKLFERFYDPSSGSIKIDGIDIREFTLDSLRSKIGYVKQDTYVFKGTVYDNIVYGANRKVEMEEVIEACKKAALLDDIKALPKGFDTDIGPDGLKLSGGQKQRVSIARVFLRDPDIILLDEATASLDNECENIIQDSLRIFKDKTIITVAHRLTTVADSDNIVVFDGHEVAEQGTHRELIIRKGVYYRLWNSKETH